MMIIIMIIIIITIIIIMSATWSTAPPRIKAFSFEMMAITHRWTQRHHVKAPALEPMCS
jgi:hypothetical protein